MVMRGSIISVSAVMRRVGSIFLLFSFCMNFGISSVLFLVFLSFRRTI